MKIKQIPLFLVVALVHGGGLAMLASPRSVTVETPPVLLSMTQMEVAAPQESPVQPQTPRREPQPATQSVARNVAPPVPAESLVADSAPPAPAAIPMPEPQVARAEPAPAAPVVAAIKQMIETQPNFQADYLKNPRPDYPSRSLALGEEGRVLLRVAVNEQGEPTLVEILKSSGFPRLDEAARRAVERSWRFAPARRGEQAVAGVVQVPISFSLRG